LCAEAKDDKVDLKPDHNYKELLMMLLPLTVPCIVAFLF